MGSVHSDDLRERFLLHQYAQQISFAATQIEHSTRATRFDRCNRRTNALLVQAYRLLKLDLLGIVLGFNLIDLRHLLRHQLLKRAPGETPLMSQISIGDDLAFRMRRQPSLATP